MSQTGYLLAVFLVMMIATFITRLIPFVAFRNKSDHPLLMYLGRYMPPAIMTLLVLYSLKSLDFTQTPYGVNELLALLLTTLLHLWRGNALLSIFSGTLLYMAAVQFGWFI
ncbi:branched-chain amino acid transporter permease [Sedimenticola selenatireducens]|jgi:branched-subunit amino acid transport protein AzlD|uniref:Branched-chain amino acid transporter n=1 Tax=Sedimenticola selenatireducens TaxID=191960 RepID=A0A557SBQ8_9GAMM|nr:AzlD domain-containing protein [Sedimenticola selenatireducens]TVO74834.1 branched-chain amino acid transporter [Sedimenticola selenatireducens]TVT62369.1 MAG: branched-chain amino acid transporter [Sedimenticola selenatireducens]